MCPCTPATNNVLQYHYYIKANKIYDIFKKVVFRCHVYSSFR